MDGSGTFIKLDRSILKWEWYDNLITKAVFIHLLLTVNYEDKKWHGMDINRGQIVTSYQKLAEELGLSVQNVRTAISHMKLTGELTCRKIAKGLVITVVRYDTYQSANTVSNTVSNRQLTGNQHATNTQLTTTKEYKEIKERKEDTSAQDADLFAYFWEQYPKKVAKKDAKRAFDKLGVDETLLNRILLALEKQKGSYDWQKDNGQFIPYPATWLNGRRWEDEMGEDAEEEQVTQSAASPFSSEGELE